MRQLARILGATILGSALLAVGATGAVAQAPPIELTGGSADWGVKASFRNYVTGPIAHGQITTSNGATTNAEGTFRFAFGSGAYDLATHAADASFTGTVHFTGHDSGAGPALDMTLANPRVATEGDTGTLYADVRSKSLSTGEFEDFPGVAFATLDLSGGTVTPGGQQIAIGPIAATLTAEGAAAFSGFYTAGTSLDPVALTLSYATIPGPGPDPEPAPGPRPEPTPQPTPQPAPQPVPEPGPQPKAEPAAPGRLMLPKGARRIGPRGVATLARVACRASACTVAARRSVRVKIGRKRYRAAVLAPRRLAEGKRARIRLKLSRKGVSALAGRTGRVALRVTIRSGEDRLTRRITATLKSQRRSQASASAAFSSGGKTG